MRKQLELLWELQKIDLALKNIKEDRDRYPKEMKRLDEKGRIEKERIQKEKREDRVAGEGTAAERGSSQLGARQDQTDGEQDV